MYIITAPQDVAVTYRNSDLGFDGHLNAILSSFGFTKEGLQLAWNETVALKHNTNFVHASESKLRQQLLPGSKMDQLSNVFLSALREALQWPRLVYCMTKYGEVEAQLSLYSLCRYPVVDAAIRSLFGRHLHDIDPEIVGHMTKFNDSAWQIFFGLPAFLGLSVTEPWKRLKHALTEFVQLPECKRCEQSWIIKTTLAEAEATGLDLESRTALVLLILWAANSNEYNIAFWVMARLLYDENLKNLVEGEIQAAWQESGALDIKYLVANCPHLDSVFYESLRLNGGAMISRMVLRKTSIGGKVLQTGNGILMPSRQLHTNEAVWGVGCARKFDALRFMRNKSLTRHSSFRPFGGGGTYCPGRVLAKEEVYGFVAILLHQYEMRIASGQGKKGENPPFPLLDDTTPGLGITGPVKCMDIIVNMKKITQ